MERAVTKAPAAGFSLIELVIAMLMASLVLVALTSILTPLIVTQVYAARAQGVQLNLDSAQQLIERELRQATFVNTPATAGMPSGVLEGCDNAAASPTPPSPVPIDPASPMRWFAFCASGGIIYYHSGASCPAAYRCGASPVAAFSSGLNPQSTLTFARPSAASTLITATLTAASGNSSAVATTAVAFSAPAGGAQ
jgi:Tfp pilus assembly protein PilW